MRLVYINNPLYRRSEFGIGPNYQLSFFLQAPVVVLVHNLKFGFCPRLSSLVFGSDCQV